MPQKSIVLVTGGAGFIGSHLCDELVKSHHVLCLDNFITGDFHNIEHLLENPDFELIKQDIIEPFSLEETSEAKKFKVHIHGLETVYHLACPTSPKEYDKFPIETLLTNAYGTKNALDIALKYKAKFLLASSGAIYGEPREDSFYFKEDYWGYINPIGPRSCYNEGKRFAESLTFTYQNKHRLTASIVRLFNGYGPRMKLEDGRMIPDFIDTALNNRPVVVYGEEESITSLCYVSDMVEAILRMVQRGVAGPVNIGSSEKQKVVDVAKKVIELCGSKSEVKFETPPAYTAKQGLPDIGLAKEKLDWFPVISLEKGLKKTITEMRAGQVVKPF